MWEVRNVGWWFHCLLFFVCFSFENWLTIFLLCDFGKKITILWNGLLFSGAKLLSVVIFLLIREAFLIICQGPLEPGVAGLVCI